MSIGLLFWVLMVLWLFSWATHRWGGQQYVWALYANELLFFVLLFLIGWKIFGFIIHE